MKSLVNRSSKALLGISIVLILIVISACSSAPPSATSSTAPPPAAVGVAITINLSAQNVAFDQKQLNAPAGAAVTMIFNNKESLPHNFALYTDQTANQMLFRGEIITGPKITTYTFTAPATPGSYFFRCDAHPSAMTGSFVVTAK